MKKYHPSTHVLFFGTRILCSPLEALYALLIFIVSKELNANALQLTILASAKPVVSIFAFYVSASVINKAEKIRNYLIALNLIGALPCLLFPFTDSVWYYIFSYVLFMTALRAAFPAWIEILRINIGLKNLGKVTAKGNSINYFITTFVPFILSYWMDLNPEIWKILFAALSMVYLLVIFLLLYLKPRESIRSCESILIKLGITLPFKECWKLVKDRNEFFKYLTLFFVSGAGLVAIQPILPIFFKENLQLSYQELTLAFSICKGVAFVLTSSLWAQLAKNISLYILNFYVNLFSCLFFAFLLASTVDRKLLLVAYISYGTMQAGCELSWNLSGPLFSKDKESTLYSGLNLIFVGIRGCICPLMGRLIFIYSDVLTVIVVAGIITLFSLIYARRLKKVTACTS